MVLNWIGTWIMTLELDKYLDKGFELDKYLDKDFELNKYLDKDFRTG